MKLLTAPHVVGRVLMTVAAVFVLLATAGPAFAQPYGGSGTLVTSSQSVPTGGTFTASGDGFAPDSSVELQLHSDPISLGTAVADHAGHFEQQVTLPASVAPGEHLLSAIGTAPDGSSLVESTTITVGAAIPRTGSDSVRWAATALVLIVVGGALLLLARSRRQSRSTA